MGVLNIYIRTLALALSQGEREAVVTERRVPRIRLSGYLF